MRRRWNERPRIRNARPVRRGRESETSGALGETSPRDSPVSEREPPIERDDLFELLGNARRRHIIEYLNEHGEPESLGTLAQYVAAQENDVGFEDVSAIQRKRSYTSLQQTHLPRLDDAGVVEFDKDGGVITPSKQLAQFSLHLDVVSKDDLPQSVVYLALSGVSLGLLVAAAVGVPVIGTLSPFWCGTTVLVLFGAVATARHLVASKDALLDEFSDH